LGNCNGNNFSNEIVLNVKQPLSQQGKFTITLNKGTDGNTIKNECGLETPEGSQLNFNVLSTVNASFTYQILYGCNQDTIKVTHTGPNVNDWQWNLDDGQHATTQTAFGIYSTFDTKKIKLQVGNGFCSDTSSQTVELNNFLQSDFTVFEDNCPNEAITFTSQAKGKIVSNLWSFGDGSTSSDLSPIHIYATPSITTPFKINYSVTDSFGCTSSKQKIITIYSSCYLAVPTAFTPNHDGKNDYLHPLNAIKAEQLDFKIYNRWGQLVFETKDWKKGWDGTINGKEQPSGVYIWFLHFKDRDSGQVRESKGTTMLIR
jgi:FOG: PKD repeat